jgi:hypothetical protein
VAEPILLKNPKCRKMPKMLKEDNKIKANQNTKVFIWWIYSKGCNGTLSAINPPNKYFCYNLSLFPKYWGNFLDTICKPYAIFWGCGHIFNDRKHNL